MEDRATGPGAGVGQSAPHCAAASVPWEGTDRHLPGTARRLGLVHDSHHPRSQQKVPDSPRVLGTRVGPHRACCPVDCPPTSPNRGGASPLWLLRVSRVDSARLGGQFVARACGCSRCKGRVGRPLARTATHTGGGPADMNPHWGRSSRCTTESVLV